MPTPAYRADQVGSFLRPQAVKDAHSAYTRGDLPLHDLRAIEDQAILEVLQLQKQVGVDVLSDGEFRRGGWSGDFADAVDGFVSGAPAVSVFNTAAGNNPQGGPARRIIGERLRQKHRLTAHESSFLKQHANGQTKMTMPAASYVLARGYRPDITDKVYGDRASALHDVADILRSEVQALASEGISYIQLDNPHYPDYVVEERNAQWRAAGVDPVKALAEDIEADNFVLDALKDKDRDGVVLAMHLCRGNGGRGQDQPAGWHTAGGYDAIAEQVFGQLHVERFLLEYDSERAGGFEPLRFIPAGKIVVLGLVTTKSGELESPDLLRRRIDEAAKYVPLEQLALSPQCGFASTMAGNPLSQDEQRRKLELVVDTARKVWGR